MLEKIGHSNSVGNDKTDKAMTNTANNSIDGEWEKCIRLFKIGMLDLYKKNICLKQTCYKTVHALI